MSKQLYQVKSYYWLVYPTKESAMSLASSDSSEGWCALSPFTSLQIEHLGGKVTFISPESCFSVSDRDGIFIKILGERVGWIVADMKVSWVKIAFEELTDV